MKVFGSRSRFAIEIGDNWENERSHRYVDVWSAGRWLTCDDNVAYVPQLCGSISSELSFLLAQLDHPSEVRRPFPELSIIENHQKNYAEDIDDELDDKFTFMYWGPTTDNLSMNIFLEDGVFYLPFSFWREEHHDPSELGKVFVAEVPAGEFLHVLHKALFELVYNWAPPEE